MPKRRRPTPGPKISYQTAYQVACDQLARLIAWCRDPLVAEPMLGVDDFWDAVRSAEISLESVERETTWERSEWSRRDATETR